MSAATMVRLRDLGAWAGGNTPSKANPVYWTDGTVPWVSPKDMKVDEIVSSEDHITKTALDDGRVSLVPEGSVLFVTRSGILAHTFPVAITKLPVTINQDLKALSPRPGISPKYVAHAIRGASQRILKQCSKHGTTVASVETNALLDFEIPVVDLEAQHRIVAEIEKQFSRLDEAVAGLQRVKANLKRYKAAVLKSAVTGRLVPTEADLARREGRSYETGAQLLQRILETRRSQWQGKGKYKEPAVPDTTDLTELPEGWVWAMVDQLADVVRGGSPRPAGDPRYFGGPVPWITVGPITADESDFLRSVPEGLTLEGKERSRYIEPQTLLLTNSGATLGVPKISLIGGCINDGVAALLDVDYPLKRYLLNFFRTKTIALRRINQGAAQPNLNTLIIKTMAVPLPPLPEQHRIVAEVDRLLSIAREVEAEVDTNLKRAQGLRQAVLSEVFKVSEDS